MLESLTLHDFQCHERLTVRFDKGVTCLVGPTDAGKSAVVRSLKWLAFSRPAGSAFVRHGSSICKVSLKVDGHRVVRRKGKDGNVYALDGKVFRAFGQEVPPEIASLLNVGPDNFADQLSSPFWFLNSPGEVSRELNAVVNLDLIDRTLAVLASEVRTAKAEAEVSERRLGRAKEQLEQLAWVEEANVKLGKIEAELEQSQEIALQAARLLQILQEGDCLTQLLRRASGAVSSLSTACLLGEELLEIERKAERLQAIITELINMEQELCHEQSHLDEVERTLAQALRERCPACGRPMK
jgi:exonuclease SbcC